ncbi:MAG: glycoside hydrolase family 99-like domain-containing protein [Planctomycetia bacterium]|nr:glycoside hydrolase family 99-like domain-containing protein [Planctomycetia bacterium]
MRFWMMSLMAVFSFFPCAASEEMAEKPLVGAIRWDAWYGKVPEGVSLPDPRQYPGAPEGLNISPDPGAETRRALSEPAVWEYRLPFYTELDADGKVVDIPGNSPEVMAKELALAHDAGLDYWAFVFYPEDCPLSFLLKTYLESPHREKIPFCLFMFHGNYGSFSEDPAMQEYALRLLSHPNYLKVQGNRPVLFMNSIRERTNEKLKNGLWDEFCRRLAEKGLGKPYLICCDWDVRRSKALLDTLGGDAISSYTPGFPEGIHVPYRQLTEHARNFWERCQATGAPVVPVCTAGWDRRPRVLNPVSWERIPKDTASEFKKCCLPGKPEQIAQHVAEAIQWKKAHPNQDGVSMILIYAWNEFDEGGWLAPTLGEGNARLEALKKVLSK